MNNRPIIGLTMGDPAGVGPELCLRTLADPGILQLCDPVIFGHAEILARLSRLLNSPLPANLRVRESPLFHSDLLTVHDPSRQNHDARASKSVAAGQKLLGIKRSTVRFMGSFRDSGLAGNPGSARGKEDLGRGPLLINCPVPEADTIVPGRVAAPCGAAAFGFVKTAIEAAGAGWIDAVVTAPVHKEALRLAGVGYPGHTEMFTALTGARRSCMMLWSEALTVTMATTHIGYAEVPQRLSPQRILDVIELTAEALALMNGRAPRLAICGLNPHAGEHGLFGNREEEELVEPAVREARAKGISIEGPLPPDTAFTAERRKRFDAIVCLYHDQGHIPFKMLAFDDGVNITLGLPIVRTSVDHGTAFDIAWQGVARPTSLFKAIECAVRLSRSRRDRPQPV